MSIRADVRDILEELSALDIPEILDEQDLSKYLLDSLDHLEFIMSVEEKFDICIDRDTMPDVRTFGDIVREIERLTRQ